MAFAIWPSSRSARGTPSTRSWRAWATGCGRAECCAATAHALDWIGVNYYTRVRVGWPPHRRAADRSARWRGRLHRFWLGNLSRGSVRRLRRAGRWGKPVVVTENGISDTDDDQRPGVHRRASAADPAGDSGRGRRTRVYALDALDNFEWSEGIPSASGWPSSTWRRSADAAAERSALRRDRARERASDAVLGRHRSLLADGRFSVT